MSEENNSEDAPVSQAELAEVLSMFLQWAIATRNVQLIAYLTAIIQKRSNRLN